MANRNRPRREYLRFTFCVLRFTPATVLSLCILATPACPRDLPDFGLMLNDDGDLSFTGRTPPESVVNLQAMVDSLAGTPVKTLMYSVAAGSDVLYYPTKVASVFGWRETKYDRDRRWAARIAKIKAGIAAGVDPIRVAGERARQLGLFFVPSYRMNDSHFVSDPLNYPLTGEFWIKHHTQYKIDLSPITSRNSYRELLDFSHEAVRQHRLGVLFETIDRYHGIMAGVELDFNRVQVLFPLGKAAERGHLITDLVAAVRQRLDLLGKRSGRDHALFVRVPPALKNCHWAGLEVEQWVERRLVDVLIPSQLMTLAHDMPVDEFVAIAKPAGCRVCPAIYPRTSWTWPFTNEHSPSSYTSPVSRVAPPELVRGAASNYWHLGATGFQLYNFNLPPDDRTYRVMRDLARPESLTRMSKVYAITPAYFLDHEDTYQYRKQIPLDLKAGQPHRLTLILGDSLAAPRPDCCALRLGLRGVDREYEMVVSLNGQELHSGAVGDRLAAATGKAPANRRAHPPPPTAYLRLPINDPRALKHGANDLRVAAQRKQTDHPPMIVEVQLGVLYTRTYGEMLLH